MSADETILIVGGGGREHALAWNASASPRVGRVLVAPGNAGTAQEPGVTNADVAADDLDGLLALAKREAVDLTIVGPEAPLAAGIVDRFQAAGQRCFGPTAAAAELESSKAFCKDFLARHCIPSAAYQVFEDWPAAQRYIRGRSAPLVIKADGLAAGKGVVVAHDRDTALGAARDMLTGGAFGGAGRRIVVEDFLTGEEASFIVMVDGSQVLPLAGSQDHKPLLDGNYGPNTGGMGAYSPAAIIDDAMAQQILETIIYPTVAGMAAEGRPFTGFLYAGLMIDAAGAPNVLEFNARLGDPETQPLLMRLTGDLIAWVAAALDGRLESITPTWSPQAALGVVLAAGGYPGYYRSGDAIAGLGRPDPAGVKVFHAGTADNDGQVVTTGGRVLSVCALGADLGAARAAAYNRVQQIYWEGMQYRRDIGAFACNQRQEKS